MMTTCAGCKKRDAATKYAVSFSISKIPPAENPEILHERCVDAFIAERYPEAWAVLQGEAVQ